MVVHLRNDRVHRDECDRISDGKRRKMWRRVLPKLWLQEW